MKTETREESVLQVPIQLLIPASFNPRRTLTAASVVELAASIGQHGVTPLIVRPHGMPNGSAFAKQHYEIISGHRRLEAAKQLELDEVPCIVRRLDDAQAAELAIVENLQREDVPPLEEGDAYNELKQRLGTAAAIAARVGKDVSYVARRLQLVSLAEMPRKALAERLITIDHALLLARLGVEEQDVNLKWALNPNSGIKEQVETTIAQRTKERDRKDRYSPWEPQSPLELKHHIEQNVGRKLSRAPWSLDDANLVPEAGPCSVCPSNTKANDTLFGDMAIAAATCENGVCFERKREAFVQIRLQSAASNSLAFPAFKLRWKATTVKPRIAKSEALNVDGFNSLQTFKYGQWIDAKKGSCEHIRMGVIIDWSDAGNRGYMGSGEKLHKPGQILTVCIAENCKVHKKGYAQPDRKGNGQRYDAKAEEAKREEAKQAAIAESKIRIAAASKAIEQVNTLPIDALRWLLIQNCFPWNSDRTSEVLMPGIKKTIQSAKVDSLEFARAIAVLSVDELSADEYVGAKERRSDFLASLKRLGYDGSGAWVAMKAPEPQPLAKPKKNILSAKAKKRITDAQRKRWAKAKVKKAARK